jgi:hypothetical protein
MKKVFFIQFFFLFIAHTGLLMAQEKQVDREAVITSLKNLSAKYREMKYLGFDIAYRFSDEKKPSIYLDSIRGSFRMNGNDYWYSLDSTEAVGNSDYMLMLFKEDKIMYLTKPSAFSIAQSPVSLIDSFLAKDPGIIYSIVEENKLRKIQLQFKEGLKYKKIEYEIDKSTGFITKMSCVVKASEMYDASVRQQVDDSGVYAVVDAVFTHYSFGKFDSSQFNTAKYFKKEGEEYIALPPYELYKVFLGNNTL